MRLKQRYSQVPNTQAHQQGLERGLKRVAWRLLITSALMVTILLMYLSPKQYEERRLFGWQQLRSAILKVRSYGLVGSVS